MLDGVAGISYRVRMDKADTSKPVDGTIMGDLRYALAPLHTPYAHSMTTKLPEVSRARAADEKCFAVRDAQGQPITYVVVD
jgi:hypothetical protein